MVQADINLHISISGDDGVPDTPTQFIVHKSTWDIEKKSRPTFNGASLGLGRKNNTTRWIYGLPDTQAITDEFPSQSPNTVILNEDRQNYLLYINMISVTGRYWSVDDYFEWKTSDTYLPAAQEMTRALTDDRSHTNKHGLNNEHNYLLGTNTDKSDPQFAKLVTGWCRFRLWNDTVSLKGIPPFGQCVAFHCINASDPDLWSHNPIDEPWLFDMPCLTGRVVEKTKAGNEIVQDNLHYPYGNFSDKLIFPIWLPTTDKGYTPYNLTRPMLKSETWQKPWIRG